MVAERIKATWELQKKVDEGRLKAKHDMEIEALQFQSFGMLEKDYTFQLEKTITAEEKKLKLLEEQTKEKENQLKIKEIEDELDKAKKDTRFGYIDEATGLEIYTYDREKVKELDKKLQDEKDSQVRDAEIGKQKNHIDSLKDESDLRKKEYDKRLTDLKEWQDKEKNAFDYFWTNRLTDEVINTRAIELIQINGFQGTLTQADWYFRQYKGSWEAQNEPVRKIGEQLNATLQSALSKDIDQFIQRKADETYQLGKSIKDSFAAGISGGSNPTPSYQSTLQAPSGGLISDTVWDNFVGPAYHSGGIAGGASSSSGELFAKLVKGEVISTERQMDNFLRVTLPSLAMSSVKVNSGSSGGVSKVVKIHIDKVEANNLEELMNSLDPYITANS